MPDIRGAVQFGRVATILFVVDIISIVVIFNVVCCFEFAGWKQIISFPLLVIIAFLLLILYVFDLYTVDGRDSGTSLVVRTISAVIVAGVVLAGLGYITKLIETEPLFFRSVLAGGLTVFLPWAAVTRYCALSWVRKVVKQVRWLVVTDVDANSALGRDILAINEKGSMSIVLPELDGKGDTPRYLNTNVVGTYDSFNKLTKENWSGVVIATEGSLPDKVVRRVMELRLSGVRIYDLTDFYEEFMQKVPIRHLRDNWFALSHGFDLLHHNMQMRIKQVLDIVFSLVLLVIASPLLLLIAIAIKLDCKGNSKGPVLYKQLRTGLNGTDFYIIKFRTMVNDAEIEGPQWAAKGDSRTTHVGRFLRRSRLDELPQLWNVLKGEMSFIGPRPERPEFNRKLEKVIPYYDLRHLTKPGIAGWAQVKYDYGSSTQDALEKLQYDIYYIKNYSLLLDLSIFFKTIRVVLGQRGR